MGDLITTGELRGLPSSDAIVMEQKRLVQSGIEPIVNHYKELAKPIPEPVQQCTDDIKQAYEAYFSNFGVNNIQWPEIAYTDSEIAHLGDEMGLSLPGLVVVSEQVGKNSFVGKLSRDASIPKDTRNNITYIGSCLTMAHELFHATAPSIVKETIQKAGDLGKRFGQKDTRVIGLDRQGLQFQEGKRHKKGYAVEEGLAMLAEHRMKTVIEKHFPKEWTIISKASDAVKDIVAESGSPPESFNVANEISFSYPESVNLVKELLTTVPDFEKLSVRARILHETLPLARAIENVYGEKSYSKIMLATEDNADKILKDMQKVHPTSQVAQAPQPTS